MCVYHIWAGPWRPEEGVRSTGTVVTDSCKPQCGTGNKTQVSVRAEKTLTEPLLSHLVFFSSIIILSSSTSSPSICQRQRFLCAAMAVLELAL